MRALFAGTALSAILAAAASPPAQFRRHPIADGLKGGYQVVAVDLDRDGDEDLIALASGMPELVWFENPGWARHVLSAGRFRMINLAACTEAGDRRPPVILLAEGFQNLASKSVGSIVVLEPPPDDVRRPWNAREIDRLPTSHRIRCAGIDGSGKPVYVNAPLTGEDAVPPDFRRPAPLVYYRRGEWKRKLIGDQNEGVVHGLWIEDLDGDRRDEILTASFGGIHLFDLQSGRWRRREIAAGDPSPWPESGSSDIAVGALGVRRFLASIEPWHGDKLAVYTEGAGKWERQVIDGSYTDGHTVVTSDLNGDGWQEIVAGYRGSGGAVYVYSALDETGEKWERQTLARKDLAAAACAVADLNGDRRPDISCIGSSTANLVWFENIGAR